LAQVLGEAGGSEDQVFTIDLAIAKHLGALGMDVATPVSHTPPETTTASEPDILEEPIFGVDLAKVKVVTCDRGCITGMLQWCGAADSGRAPEKVAFTLLQIRPGYTVVGECLEGPKLLSSLCWKLQSINGYVDASVASVRRGDSLLLEAPRWPTTRLIKKPPPEESSATPPRRSSELFSSPVIVSDKPPAAPQFFGTPVVANDRLTSEDMEEGPPLMRPAASLSLLRVSAQPQIASPSHTRRPAKTSDMGSVASSQRDAASAAAFREVTSTTNRSQERPLIPVLDMSVVSAQQQELLRRFPVTPTGNFGLPPLRQAAGNACNPTAGCDLGLVECNMVVRGKATKTRG
jgi:hypothetical protein